MTKTDTIAARFNGTDTCFRIHREALPYFEARHGSAYALCRRIMAGHWTTIELAEVLRFASAPRPTKGEFIESYLFASELDKVNSRELDDIDRAFLAKGPGTYASLAAAVLMASLSGIAEDDARFTDEDDEQ